jgi:hypothetical protein
LAETKNERTELSRALQEVDAALDDTLVERVLGLAHDDSPPFYVLEALGEVPLSRDGQRAWCGLAAEIERYRDRHGLTNEFLVLGPERQFELHQVSDGGWRRVNHLIQEAGGIIDAAHALDRVKRYGIDATDSRTWVVQVTAAEQQLLAEREVAIPEIVMEAEPDLGLGW